MNPSPAMIGTAGDDTLNYSRLSTAASAAGGLLVAIAAKYSNTVQSVEAAITLGAVATIVQLIAPVYMVRSEFKNDLGSAWEIQSLNAAVSLIILKAIDAPVGLNVETFKVFGLLVLAPLVAEKVIDVV